MTNWPRTARAFTRWVVAIAALLIGAPCCASVPLTPYAKLTASDGASDDRFGASVAIDGGLAIVGAYGDDDGGSDAGAAYLFDVATGQQTAKLLAADAAAFDEFGRGVALEGGVALAGAPYDADNGFGSGSADAIDIATGRPGGKLVADDAAVGDLFAAQVAIDGGVAIVGAEYDDDNGNASGSAYLFDVATGQQTVKLTPDDGDREARFGYRVAIDGGVALVGAPRDDGNGINSGAAYLFDVATGRQTAKLTAADPVAQDHFGSSVAIDGGVAIVGAPYDGDNGFASGAAYLFDAATGQQLAKLLPSDGSSLDRFGLTVAIDGGLALVSAQGEDAFGSVYLFDVGAGRELAKLAPGEVEAGEGFGSSVALDGGVAIVGAPGDDSDSGAAYLFDVSAFVIPEPTGAALAFAAMLAATGARARIRTRQRSE